MKRALAVLCVVAALGVALAADDGWMEPTYTDAAVEQTTVETASFLEDGTRAGVGAKGRIRGISHTVGGHHGMVTYISPARKLQTSGIVLTPPPVVSVVTATPQVFVQPVVYPHAHYHGVRRQHLPYLTVDDYGHNGDDHFDHALAHDHHHHHHHRHQRVHPVYAHHHNHHHFGGHAHGHHVLGHTAGHSHHFGGNPVAVPASLFTEPYHQPHYNHKSPISQGPILVPHGPAGAIALEDPAYTGYNPGPVYQLNSVPTGYYSDGTPYRASINQRYNA